MEEKGNWPKFSRVEVGNIYLYIIFKTFIF